MASSVLVVGVLALATGLAAAWFATPRPAPLEGERWFKTALADRLVAAGIPPEALARWAPYHPLGRLVEQKLARPASALTPGGPLPGERELLQALTALPDARSRWEHLAAGTADALLRPAAPLSVEHTARRWLGPDVPLDEAPEEAERRLHARWVLLAGTPVPGVPDAAAALEAFARRVDVPALVDDPGLRDALARFGAALAGLERAPWWTFDLVAAWWRLASAALLAALVEGVAQALRDDLPDDDLRRRLIVVATGDAAPVLLRALSAHIPVRDRVLAVVSVGGAIGGVPGVAGPLGAAGARDWLDQHFRHELLDVEVVRLVPYVSLAWLDPDAAPPGAGGLPVALQRFPEPGFVGREPAFVEVVDLGALLADPELPVAHVAAALRLVTDLRVLARH